MTAFVLLCPGTPMLFMGQEWGAANPFPFFADHAGELAQAVATGRRGFLAQFPSQASPAAQAQVPDPADRATFERAILDYSERQTAAGRAALALHRDLLALRRSEATVRAASAERGRVDGAVLGTQAFVIRSFGDRPGGLDDRLLVVNLRPGADLVPAPEPLLAPPDGHRWAVRWSSDDPRYGGPGTREVETDAGWALPPECAVLLAPEPAPD